MFLLSRLDLDTNFVVVTISTQILRKNFTLLTDLELTLHIAQLNLSKLSVTVVAAHVSNLILNLALHLVKLSSVKDSKIFHVVNSHLISPLWVNAKS